MEKDVCPSCGYCRHCGRGRQLQPYYPNPWNTPYYPYWWERVWCGTATDTNGSTIATNTGDPTIG